MYFQVLFIGGTRSDIHDKRYQTEPDIGIFDIGLKRAASDTASDVGLNSLPMFNIKIHISISLLISVSMSVSMSMSMSMSLPLPISISMNVDLDVDMEMDVNKNMDMDRERNTVGHDDRYG